MPFSSLRGMATTPEMNTEHWLTFTGKTSSITSTGCLDGPASSDNGPVAEERHFITCQFSRADQSNPDAALPPPWAGPSVTRQWPGRYDKTGRRDGTAEQCSTDSAVTGDICKKSVHNGLPDQTGPEKVYN